jgi:hypothetical protein
MNKNRIGGDASRGERAINRETPATKGERRRFGGSAVKSMDPYLGRPRFTPERATWKEERSEESAEGIVVRCSGFTRLGHSPERGETAGLAEPGTAVRRPEREGERGDRKPRRCHAPDVQTIGAPAETQG